MAPKTTQEAGERHKRGGIFFEDFGWSARAQAHLHGDVVMTICCFNMTQSATTTHRPFLRAGSRMGQPLMNSLFTLGLMIGISVNDLTVGTIIANLTRGSEILHPLFEGDTVHCSTEIIGKRESKSRKVPVS
jgi:hypothetical protein